MRREGRWGKRLRIARTPERLNDFPTYWWVGIYFSVTPCLQIAISRAEYYAYLKRIVDAGYGDRVMFGSDVGLADFGTGIDAIVDADFLTEAQKRDILYNNAARFLRLSNDVGEP